jgi:hypothetical protein
MQYTAVSEPIPVRNPNGGRSEEPPRFRCSYTFANIAKAVVVVTDGSQYAVAGRYNNHDYRSYSARITF